MADQIPDEIDELLASLEKKVQQKVKAVKEIQKVLSGSSEDIADLVKDAIRAAKAKKQSLNTAPNEFLNPHDQSYHMFGDSKLAMMLFMDIVEYSELKNNNELKRWIHNLNKVVLDALQKAGCDLDSIICLPSGDGMCLCFTDHTKPLVVAEHIHQALRGGKMKLRMGIHLGGVLRVKDLKGCFNLAGDAINMTQRAMDYGDEHHILCTKAAYDQLTTIEGIDDEVLKMLGPCEVKHGKELELYNYVCDTKKVGNPNVPKKSADLLTKSRVRSRKPSSDAQTH